VCFEHAHEVVGAGDLRAQAVSERFAVGAVAEVVVAAGAGGFGDDLDLARVALEHERSPGTRVVFATEKGGVYGHSGFQSIWLPALFAAGRAHEETKRPRTHDPRCRLPLPLAPPHRDLPDGSRRYEA
jgi:hypothetical protein